MVGRCQSRTNGAGLRGEKQGDRMPYNMTAQSRRKVREPACVPPWAGAGFKNFGHQLKKQNKGFAPLCFEEGSAGSRHLSEQSILHLTEHIRCLANIADRMGTINAPARQNRPRRALANQSMVQRCLPSIRPWWDQGWTAARTIACAPRTMDRYLCFTTRRQPGSVETTRSSNSR